MASNCAMIRSAFSDSVESLLTGLLEVFPECQATRTTVDAFHAFIKGNEQAEHSMITAFGECVKNGTQLVQGRDEEALFAAVEQIPVLKSIDIRSKWSDEGFDDASKETLWNYVKVLNAYSKVYILVPDSIMSRVEEVLNGVGECTGNFDMVKMVEQVTSSFGENPIDCGALSEDRVNETLSALGDLISIQAPGLNVADLVGHFATKTMGVPVSQQPKLVDK
jgi:hypothetical protein